MTVRVRSESTGAGVVALAALAGVTLAAVVMFPADDQTAFGATTTSLPTTEPVVVDLFEQRSPAFSDLAVPLLGDGRPITVLAPVDGAWAAFTAAVDMEIVMADEALQQALVDAHVVDGVVPIDGLGAVVTRAGQPALTEDAGLVTGDLSAADGLVHVIDNVIVPDALAAVPPPPVVDVGTVLREDGRFSMFLQAVDRAGLVQTLSDDVVVFAPTDDAFALLPPGIVDSLLDHPERMRDLLSGHVADEPVADGAVTTRAGVVWQVDDVAVGDVAVALPVAATDVGVVIPLDGVLVWEGLVLADLGQILGLGPVVFTGGSAEVPSEAFADLQRVAEFVQSTDLRVLVAAHTDADGSAAGNQVISEQRAAAVASALTAAGLPSDRVQWVGYGETQPVASNATPEGRAENRRIEFLLAG